MDYELMLFDRISKIQSINEQYDLESNGYISFSGGKDSVVLSRLIDIALPNNNIPRVYVNTGMEYTKMVKFVKRLSQLDNRIIIKNNEMNIPRTLKHYGYPFKSKSFSSLVLTYYNMKSKGLDVCDGYKKRIQGDDDSYDVIPKIVRYIFDENAPIKISDKCCIKFKERILKKFEKDRKISITGIRKDEGGRRSSVKGCLTRNGTKFHPLLVVSDDWEDEFIKRENLELCELYYPPYNFKRTGCKGCPFNRNIQKDLEVLHDKLPNEYYQCIHLWKPVYDEYIRVGYRLKYYPHLKEVK